MCALFTRKAMPAGKRPGQALVYMQDTQGNCARFNQVPFKTFMIQTNRRNFRGEVHLRFISHS